MSEPFANAQFIAGDVQVENEGHGPIDDRSSDGGVGDAEAESLDDGRKEYGEVDLVALRCPLFILTTPDVAGCKTTMSMSGSGVWGWSMKLKLFGNGVSMGKKLTVSWSQEVSVSAGRQSQIFLPLWVEVQQVTTYFADGREERVGYEVRLKTEETTSNRIGVESLTEWTPPSLGRALFESHLKDDTDTEPVTQSFEYKLESSGGFTLGFKAFDADQTVGVDVAFTKAGELTAELAPGHDYVGIRGGWPPYISWSVDGVQN